MSENSQDRGQWASKFGFLMAAIGSAVGLGNIWGFPYKMGMNGGGAYLMVYLVLVVFVGVMVMLAELAMGRKTGKGALLTYRELTSGKFSWVGYMAVLSPFIILAFYSVLGGMVTKYIIFFAQALMNGGFGAEPMKSGTFFGSFICNGGEMIAYFAVFQALTLLIVMGGIEGGIERFNKYAIPALAVILLGLIVYMFQVPGAEKGFEFMFKPNFDALSTPSGFLAVLKSASGQMFFSLSLGMGIMITYGSYLSKDQDLSREMYLIPLADTIVAVMAGMVVMPACFAFGLPPKAGPSLLFVSLHEVFVHMGGVSGAFVGLAFYVLVFLAAISSSVSLLEVVTTFVLDRQAEHGKTPKRIPVTLLMATLIFILGFPVCLDGLGSNVAGGASINCPGVIFGMQKITMAFDCWLDFYDMLSEGVMMPLGALVMSLLIGYKWGVKMLIDEAELTPGVKMKGVGLMNFCFKVIVPCVLALVLYTQIMDFFG